MIAISDLLRTRYDARRTGRREDLLQHGERRRLIVVLLYYDLQIGARIKAVGKLNAVRVWPMSVPGREHALKEQYVGFQRSLIAFGGIAATDRQKVIRGAGIRSEPKDNDQICKTYWAAHVSC